MIGYYAHHHGSGHVQRMRAIAAQLHSPVTALSSADPPRDWRSQWVCLPLESSTHADGMGSDCTAGGTLHWAPRLDQGLRERMGLIAEWIRLTSPAAMVIDVSVEVAVLVRSMGVPTIVMRMPGERLDPPHRLAYDMAESILAPVPALAADPRWPSRWRAKTDYVGAVSLVDDRPLGPPRQSGPPHVVVLCGSGGNSWTEADLRAAQESTPDWRWTVLGGPDGRWVADPWPVISTATVVVTHGGQNAIAEIAAARRAAIVIPQERPYDEQRSTARTLERGDFASVCAQWPPAEEWPALLSHAAIRDPMRWGAWSFGDGATRAATVIERVAARSLMSKETR